MMRKRKTVSKSRYDSCKKNRGKLIAIPILCAYPPRFCSPACHPPHSHSTLIAQPVAVLSLSDQAVTIIQIQSRGRW